MTINIDSNTMQSISNIVAIATLIVTLISSICSIHYAKKTLKQNNKMIEESTRPELAVYYVSLYSIGYFIIKNVGSSTAIVDYMDCDYEFSTQNGLYDEDENVFKNINNTKILKNQSLQLPVISDKLVSNEFNFTIKYHSTSKSYIDKLKINITTDNPFYTISNSSLHEDNGVRLKRIESYLYEILKREI